MFKQLLTLIFLSLAVCASARPITPDEATAVATEFLNSLNASKSSTKKTGVQPVRKQKSESTENSSLPFYVFNADDGEGFVIVSGDNCAKQILGYSDRGSFDFNNLPPQLAAMLEQYAEQINALPESATTDASWTSPLKATISSEGKLLETASWGQGYPYNAQCPVVAGVQCPTGCVATAMAIVMKYHNWPENYDWDSMPMESPENPIESLSKLMADAGEAVYMNYGPYESGAHMNWVGHRLQQSFKYSTDCQFITRANFSDEEWEGMLKGNLDNNNPVIYNGSGTGNHAFIIDGYQDDTYHINWGWDGMCNGYFLINALCPNESQDFSNDSGMVININPDKTGKEYSECFIDYGYFWASCGYVPGINLSCDKLETDAKFDVCVKSVTIPAGFDGIIGLALVDENDNVKQILGTRKVITWSDAYQMYTTLGYDLNLASVQIKVDIEDSDRLQIVSKEKSSTEWLLVLGTIETQSYINVTDVKANTCDVHITITNPDLKVQFFKSNDWVECSFPESSFKAVKGSSLQFSAFAPENSVEDGFVVFNILGKDLYGDNFSISDTSRVDYAANAFGDHYEIKVDYVIAKDDKTIHNEVAGQLKNLISTEEYFATVGLTLSGKINATDIWFIRDNLPNLKKIDLSQVEIAACIAEDSKNVGFTDPNNLENYMPRFSFTNMKNLTIIILPKNLVGVSDYGIMNTMINTIDLPSTVNYIGLNAFSGCINLETVICRNPQPVNIQDCAFTYSKCPVEGILYVPIGSANAYQTSSVWQDFHQIIEFDNELIFMEEYEEDSLIYKIKGRYAVITGFNAEKISPNVVIPETISIQGNIFCVMEIGEGAFKNSEIESITMGDGIEVIGHGCFLDTRAKKIRLSDNIKILPGASLSSLWIEEINLPANLEWMYSPMSNMRSLKQLYIPAGAKRAYNRLNIGNHFDSLKEFSIDPLNEDMCVLDGVLFDKEAKLLLNYPGSKSGSYTVPSSVTRLAEESFVGCSELTELIFTENLKEIGNHAIGECERLEHLSIPNVCFLGISALRDLKQLKSLTLGDVSFEGHVIFSCDSLKNIYLKNEKYLDLCNITYKNTEEQGIYDYYYQGIEPKLSIYELNKLYVPGAVSSKFSTFEASKVVEMWSYEIDKELGVLRIIPQCDGLVIDEVNINGLTIEPSAEYYYKLPQSYDIDVVMNYTLHNRQTMTTHYDSEFNASLQDSKFVLVDETALSSNDVIVYIGNSYKLSATILPGNATVTALSWSSSDNNVATVDETGNITAVGCGSAIITLSVKDLFDMEHTSTCVVKVQYMPGDANGNGSLAVNDVVLTARGVVKDLDPALILEAVDMNGDDTLTVGDLTQVVNAVISYTPQTNISDRNSIKGIDEAYIASSLLLTQTGNDINVAFDNDGSFTGVQFDVIAADGLTVTSVTLDPQLRNSHSVANHWLESGALRMLAYGTEPFTANEVFATIHTENPDMLTGNLMLTNIMASDFNGNLYSLPDCMINLSDKSGIDTEATEGMSIAVDGHTLIITSDDDNTVVISDMKGIRKSLNIHAGTTFYTLPSGGVYVINNHKIVIR